MSERGNGERWNACMDWKETNQTGRRGARREKGK